MWPGRSRLRSFSRSSSPRATYGDSSLRLFGIVETRSGLGSRRVGPRCGVRALIHLGWDGGCRVHTVSEITQSPNAARRIMAATSKFLAKFNGGIKRIFEGLPHDVRQNTIC